jgi:hypothetical protein
VLQVLVYLGLGILSDILVTAYYIFVGRQWAALASSISIPIALLNFYVLNGILIQTTSLLNALAYAAGNAIGCFAIIKAIKLLKGRKS